MNAIVNENCIGCGLCNGICPKVFEMGSDGLLFQTVQLIILTHVAGHGDDLGVVVVFLQPGDDDGSVQTAGISQHYFLDFSHCFFLRILRVSRVDFGALFVV